MDLQVLMDRVSVVKPPADMSEEFVNQPNEIIDEARKGSPYELEVLARHWQNLPDGLSDGLEDVFFHHLNSADPPSDPNADISDRKDEEGETETYISNESLKAFWSLYALAQTRKPLDLYSADRYAPGIIKAWPGVFKWSAFFFVSRIQIPLTSSDHNPDSAAFKRSTRNITREVISRAWVALAWSEPARKVMLDTHGVVEIAAKLWILEDDEPEEDEEEFEDGLLVRSNLLSLLSREKDHTATVDRIIEAAGENPARIARTALTRLKQAFKSPQFIKDRQDCIAIFSLIMQFCTSSRSDIRKAFLDQGAVAVAVRLLLRIASAANAADHPGHAPNSMLLVFPYIFLQAYLEATDGYDLVLQALNAGLLIAFVECSPLYKNLSDTEYLVISTTITDIVPKYMAYLPVLQTVDTALKTLGRAKQFSSLRSTKAWKDFTNLSQWTAERIVVMEYSKAMKKNNAICYNLRCTKADVRNNFRKCGQCGTVLYCSKECQVAHWKEGHKRVCMKKEDFSRVTENGNILPLRDLNYMQILSVRLARNSLPHLRDLAARDQPHVPLKDLMVLIDYTDMPPKFGVALRAKWAQKRPDLFNWPKHLFRADLEPETFTTVYGVVPHGEGKTRMVLSVVSGCIWNMDRNLESMKQDAELDTAMEAKKKEYWGL
ncbi:hypothetical protein BDN72DRAFT_797066 [Pluteus cervinus]|uniref:Uncharacterized protein n=1 Tax=Pluteus cervinus TaxID=181527 RepID=A0ACD3ATF6_9AGAR|nr:hypothetical protein BDN72DRAFT_797066 [Pluteus cervinus]